MAGLQKGIGKAVEYIAEAFVVYIRPIESLFKTLAPVVGVVLGVYAIADNEYLHILVQGAIGPKGMALVAVNLVKGFL